MNSAIRVLVVDDDVAVQSSLNAYLEDMGFSMRSTASATDALSILANETFDAAVVDVRLREMTGEELVLKAHALRPPLRFLIYTGSLGYEVPDSLKNIGISQANVLYKPVRAMSIVADQIRRLVE